MYKLFDVQPDEFSSTFEAWQRTVHPADVSRALAEVNAALCGPDPLDTQFRILTQSGGVRHVRAAGRVQRDDRGEAMRMVGLNWDVTREAVLGEELHAQRRFMENILNAVTDPIFVKDQDHRYIYGNRAFNEVLRRQPEEYLGKEDGDFFSQELTDDFLKSDTETLARMTDIEREQKLVTPDGVERTILTKKTPFMDPDGQKTIVGIIRDITERKAMERQLADERARQAAASRLASLGEMAGGVAHEINNPLAIINGYVGRLQNLLNLDPIPRSRAVETANKIEATTNRIATIVKGLRAISRDGGSDPLEKASLNAIIQDALDLCSERFMSGGVEVQVLCEPNLYVNCRPVQIAQVLLNLMTNAYYAVVGLAGESAKMRVVARRQGGWIEISVTDWGPGVDRKIRDRIFEPFFTTKPVGEGTGLGLSIAMSIVREHGGELTLDTESEQTCFCIRLPAALRQQPLPSLTRPAELGL